MAANLLGIEEVKQIHTHPLRGALLENLVITEILKYRFNRGRKENLSFFRDAKGHELDLVYHTADQVILVEIKSAGTLRSEFFKGLQYFHDSIKPAAKRILVYDGDRHEERSAGLVTNVRQVTELL